MYKRSYITKILIFLSFIFSSIFLIFSLTSCAFDSKVININQSINDKYIVQPDENIYIGQEDYLQYGNGFIDLEKLSRDNANSTNFMINGTINFGLLIDPDLNNVCINGKNNALISLGASGSFIGGTVAAIACGRTHNVTGTNKNWSMGNLSIGKNINFSIFATQTAIGVSIYSIKDNSVVYVNGTYSLGCNPGEAYGVNIFECRSNSTLVVNGLFTIQATQSVYGINIDKSDVNSHQIIRGIFYEYSGSRIGRGIYFYGQANGYLNLNSAMFYISSYQSANLMEFRYLVVTINVTIFKTITTLYSGIGAQSFFVHEWDQTSTFNISPYSNIFYANKGDGGDWNAHCSATPKENWNGVYVNSNEQTSETPLTEVHVPNSHLYWSYAPNVDSSSTTIKNKFISKLNENNSSSNGFSPLGASWIDNLITLL